MVFLIKEKYTVVAVVLSALWSIASATNATTSSSCVDTIAEHPVCRFGSICTCEALIAQTPCGDTMNMAGQSVAVNDVCSLTCEACDDDEEEVDTAADPTMEVPEDMEDMEDEYESECMDTIEDHPVCLFGRQCDCLVLTDLPESPCGSIMTGSGQSVAVNEICAETCDACDEVFGAAEIATATTTNSTAAADADCVDIIADHPVCLFGSLCDCVELTSGEDNPCGSSMSNMGQTVEINDLCAKTCNACGVEDTDSETGYTGPVYGHLPMGIIDDQRTDVYYTVGEDKVDFVMNFPDSIAWSAFQFWGGDFKGITDGRLGQATSGFECLIKDEAMTATTSEEKASHVHCRARRVRHLFTRYADLPGPMDDLINQHSVASCNPQRALVNTAAGVPFCNYDPSDVRNSSLIISSSDTSSELVFVTDMLFNTEADMLQVDVTHHPENATYTARWSRSRFYPWGVSGDGTTLNVRWGVSPRGVSNWVEGDMPYHGRDSYGRWITGGDFMFMDAEAQAAHDPKYMEEINTNTHRLSISTMETRLSLFRTKTGGATKPMMEDPENDQEENNSMEAEVEEPEDNVDPADIVADAVSAASGTMSSLLAASIALAVTMFGF